MPRYSYTLRRGFFVLLVGFGVGLLGSAVVPARIQEQMRLDLDPQTVATVSGLAFVGLDFLNYSRSSKGRKQNIESLPVPVEVQEDLSQRRGR